MPKEDWLYIYVFPASFDFSAYIQEIKQLGVTAFETWVVDSYTEYFVKITIKQDPNLNTKTL
jgi:hypothetical protein